MIEIDFKHPDYTEVFKIRQLKLNDIKSNPVLLRAMKVHYRHNPWDFIRDWAMTFDPRQIEKGLLATIPFIPWPKQLEFLHWLDDRWKSGEYGIVEKSRDCGVTWLALGYVYTKWLFEPGFSAGVGSQKEIKVDKKGDPDCLFEKLRFLVRYTPEEFMPEGFNHRLHDGFMKLINPENGATITGEVGDDIGRGGRKSIWLVDEYASIEHQLMVDNSLSAATNCQIDISTYKGNGNLFYRKALRFHGTRKKFIFDWRDDPRKDDIWYAKQKSERDPITIAQEIDRDPNASAEDVFIPAQWVKAAIDLHKLIKVAPSGIRATSFDPADTGDSKGVVSRHGYVITAAELKIDGDITDAIPWAYELAFKHNSEVLSYDADGMGAPVMKLTFKQYASGTMAVIPFYGSGAVFEKDKRFGEILGELDTTLKTNGDTFENFRSQAATWMRDRFEGAYKVRKQIEEGGVVMGINFDEIISIDSDCVNAFELVAELSRPKRVWSNNGKLQVESKKAMKSRGIESPGLFDACMMNCAIRGATIKKRRDFRVKSIGIRDSGVGM